MQAMPGLAACCIAAAAATPLDDYVGQPSPHYAWHAGEKEIGPFRGLTWSPLGLFLRTSVPVIWHILSGFLPA
jgi:hypothetical protein